MGGKTTYISRVLVSQYEAGHKHSFWFYQQMHRNGSELPGFIFHWMLSKYDKNADEQQEWW